MVAGGGDGGAQAIESLSIFRSCDDPVAVRLVGVSDLAGADAGKPDCYGEGLGSNHANNHSPVAADSAPAMRTTGAAAAGRKRTTA